MLPQECPRLGVASRPLLVCHRLTLYENRAGAKLTSPHLEVKSRMPHRRSRYVPLLKGFEDQVNPESELVSVVVSGLSDVLDHCLG